MAEDRYQFLERLATGSSDTVFKGYDHQLKRQVALKRLMNRHGTAGGAANEDALRREAAALAALRHPNVVAVFDVGSDEQGVFLVMEWVEDRDLAEWLRSEGRMPITDFVRLAEELLEALIAAHDQNILHRNIKPKNIKVQRGPTGKLQVKLSGFGLARVSQVAMKQTVDQSGNVLGTVHYMAPEQFLRQPLDNRTDLYSLGCVLYEALVGQPAFEAESVAAIMDKHLKHSLAPLAELRPDVPPALCGWVESLLSFEIAARPESAPAAMRSLRGLVETLPVSNPKPPLALPAAAVAASGVTGPTQTLPPRRPGTALTVPGRVAGRRAIGAPGAAPRKRLPLPWLVSIASAALILVIASLWANHLRRTGAFAAWEPLFNGTDLAGWNSSKGNWMVENGVIRCKPGNRDRATLDSERMFENFIVEFEFSLADSSANSGIILPNDCQPDIGPGRTGSVYPGKSGLPQPPKLAEIPDPQPGEWHRYRVTVRNPRIWVEVDGLTTAIFTDPNTKDYPLAGPLRFEGSEGIRIRNVRVKSL